MKARFIHEIGTRAWLRIYWGKGCGHPEGCHNAMAHLVDSDKNEDWKLGGAPADYPDERWPTACEDCGAPVPPEASKEWGDDGYTRQVHHKRLYDTASGNPEPGDIFFTTWEHAVDAQGGRRGWCAWSNCAGPHLHGVLPSGVEWQSEGRCSNCTMPEDTTHRCWVRHGDPSKGEPVHVDKGGHTCAAGAGSIIGGNWHGFLHQGEWRSC
jgi:hypothetical protein